MFQAFLFNKKKVHFFSIKQVAQPRVAIALEKVYIEEPKFNQSDPSLVIVDKTSSMSSLHQNRISLLASIV